MTDDTTDNVTPLHPNAAPEGDTQPTPHPDQLSYLGDEPGMELARRTRALLADAGQLGKIVEDYYRNPKNHVLSPARVLFHANRIHTDAVALVEHATNEHLLVEGLLLELALPDPDKAEMFRTLIGEGLASYAQEKATPPPTS